jgi:hypothetical protein
MMSSPWVDRNISRWRGHSESGFAGVQKGAAVFFLASIGVSVLAALEQVERMREKYSYGEIVSRKKPPYPENEFAD